MRLMVILFLLKVSLSAIDTTSFTLRDWAILLSDKIEKPIIFDNDIGSVEVSFVIKSNSIPYKEFYSYFEAFVLSKGYKILDHKDYIYVSRTYGGKTSIYSYKLRFMPPKQFIEIVNKLVLVSSSSASTQKKEDKKEKKKVDRGVSASSVCIPFKSSIVCNILDKYNNDILVLLNEFDKPQKLVKYELFVVELSSDFGSSIDVKLSDDKINIDNSKMTLLLDCFKNSCITPENLINSLTFLSSAGRVNTSFNPVFYALLGSPVTLNLSQTQPVKDSVVDKDNSVKTVYKDVDIGLKVDINSRLVNEKSLIIDLNIDNRSLISNKDNLPVTQNQSFKTSLPLEHNQTAVLSGFTSKSTSDKMFAIPFISLIPYIGDLFKFKNETKTDKKVTFLLRVRLW